MKHSRQLLLSLLLLFLLPCYTTRATRLPTPKQGKEEVMVNLFSEVGHSKEIEEEDSWTLMAMEDCGNGDEECLKRRMTSEAHLDYIYTQHHKP
ncbi:putative phytosulfokines 6 [Magnolia sinica]|uniref:putative phytosulfokines 6 n=1 Tax=Magnolia sinica TaxID=86752 RepID=UPI00265A14B8|nr:putative phytosulfokines 6 [Magnolia sinica]